MRAKVLLVPVLFATALALTAAAAPVGATSVATSSSAEGRPSVPAKACLDNQGPAGGVGSWVNSENDTAAASDFRVGSRCVITLVTVGGFFFNGDGGDSFDVVVYKNDRSTGTPGEVIAGRASLAYTYDPDASLVTLHPDRITLPKGTYWISVVANMAVGEGSWGWGTSYTKTGRPDLWQNPGGGGSCQTWGTFKHCLHVRPANLVVTAGS